MEKKVNTGKVFLIAGSEPLGSAGVQADIKAITRCGGWAAAALTCIVDEDVNRIKGIHHLPTDLIVSQAESFLSTVGADSIKTGLLPTEEIIRAVAGVNPIFVGKTIVDLNWRKKYNVNVIALITDGHADATILPDTVIKKGSRAVLSGHNDALERFRNVNSKGLD